MYPLPRSDAAFRLAANAFNRINFGDNLVATLADVVSSTHCATLVPGHPAHTATIVESALGTNRGNR